MKVKTEKPKYADKRRETIFKKRKRKGQKKKKKNNTGKLVNSGL